MKLILVTIALFLSLAACAGSGGPPARSSSCISGEEVDPSPNEARGSTEQAPAVCH